MNEPAPAVKPRPTLAALSEQTRKATPPAFARILPKSHRLEASCFQSSI